MDETTGELRPAREESMKDVSGVPYSYEPASRTAAAGRRERQLDELRAEIEQTEAEMVGTLNAIQDKLSFEHIRSLAEEKILDAMAEGMRSIMKEMNIRAKEYGNSTLETIKQHPVSFALMGLGLGWLLVRGVRSSSDSRMSGEGWNYSLEHGEALPEDIYQSGLEEPGGSEYREGGPLASGGGMRVGKTVEKLRSRASDATHRIGHVAEQLREKVSTHRPESEHQPGEEERGGFSQILKATPLTIGVAAFTLGLLIGIAAPESGRERKLLEGTRESLKEKAKEFGEATLHKVEHVFGKATDAAKEEAEKQGLTM